LPLSHCQYWIFDMDGTLTIPVHDFEMIRTRIGISSGVPILEAIEKMPKDEAEAANQLLHDLEMDLAFQAQPQPQAKEVLQDLVDKGKELAILTRNGEEIGHATLKAAGLDEFFNHETIIGRDRCAPKPLPDGVFHLLNYWSAPKEKTVIVGDYLYDIQAGFDAGINTVHFDSTEVFQWPEYTHHKISRLKDISTLY
jgi:HAD superfamily hydrolase (TIGR01509 family)